MVLRTGGEFAQPHLAQDTAQRLRRDRDPELLPQPLAKISDPPAHHTVDRWCRAALDDLQQGGAMRCVQERCGARRLTVAQPVRPLGVEPDHPVPHDLQRHVAEQRGLRAAAAIIDHCQRKQATRLRRILAAPRKAPKSRSREVRAKGDGIRHGEPPVLTSMNHICAASGNPRRESAATRLGIICHLSPPQRHRREKSDAFRTSAIPNLPEVNDCHPCGEHRRLEHLGTRC